MPMDAEDFNKSPGPAAARRSVPPPHRLGVLSVSGRMGFHAVVDQPLRPAQGHRRGRGLYEAFAQAALFPLTLLHEFSGAVRYTHEQVYLTDLCAATAPVAVGLTQGHVVVKPGGGFQARLVGVRAAPLKPDADLLAALPDWLEAAWRRCTSSGPLTATADLVVDSPGERAGRWCSGGIGTATLHDAALRLGVDVAGVEGQTACCGLFNGQRLESVVGNVLLGGPRCSASRWKTFTPGWKSTRLRRPRCASATSRPTSTTAHWRRGPHRFRGGDCALT